MTIQMNCRGSPPWLPKCRAFTLIEILVVIVIIGIVTATTLFTLGDGGQSRRIQAMATQLQTALGLAQTQAILTSTAIGFKANAHSYSFYLFTTQKDRQSMRLNAAWVPIKNNTVLTAQKIPTYIYLSIATGDSLFKKGQMFVGNPSKNKPDILILPSGGFTPFILIISDKNKNKGYVINGDRAGNLTLTVWVSKKANHAQSA
ncbi:MAG: type II secretion system minor pseudopilin GspH [Gammaproteobacteria bacterium]|nr:type II secretion system minor pseudopilin GspH [Gammaproteobacteria bacterium]